MWRTALLLAALCVLYSSHYGRSQGRLHMDPIAGLALTYVAVII